MNRFVLTGFLLTALIVGAVRLPAQSCPVSSSPIGKSCRMGCCANKCCCVESQKNHNLPSIPLVKDTGAHHELVAVTPPTLTTGAVQSPPKEISPSSMAMNVATSAPQRAVLCTFLI
jgi:hypothetical protein